ncbi:phage major capsid protein [Hymenobacter setariae]|uniref:Phage major capsid protein n=1 Tax=Hymenobacter setariae TaxID=2594794 RepID=A0A558BSV8_9BACT|nr:phage major capsid protein [Hymenobacter setariae]TVT39628.1 phage major capsid protein [Hymenobacter setariae]
MKNAKALREERQAKIDQAQGLISKAQGEKRGLTSEESGQLDALHIDIDTLEADLRRVEKQERLNAEEAGRTKPLNTHNTTEERATGSYSFLRAIQAAGNPDKLTGLEKEMHQEAIAEARDLGQEIHGVGVPMRVLQGRERRDNTVTQGDQPADGRVLVVDERRGMIELLRDQLVTNSLGATVLTGLKGDIIFPTHTQGAVSTWKGEIETLDKSNIKFGSQKMAPHRLGTYVDLSKQLIIQSSIDIEAFVRNEIIGSVTRAVDVAAIYGDGQDNEPLGLLNNGGISKFVGGANGAIPDLATLVALEAMVDVNNAAVGTLKYLLSNKIKGTLKTQPVAQGNPLMVLNSNTELNGFPFVASNLVKDSTKGTATAASAVVFGNWADLFIGQWGGMDITRDDITLALKGEVRLIINTFWDVMLRRQKSFAAMLDAVPNATISQAAVNAR